MKKLVGAALVALSMLTLASCGGSSPNTTILKQDLDGVKAEITLTTKGDKVVKLKQVSKISYSAPGLADRATVEKMLKQFADSYNGLKGVTYKTDFAKADFTETITIDYNKADINQLKKSKRVPLSGTDKELKNGISLKKTMAELKKQGFSEK